MIISIQNLTKASDKIYNNYKRVAFIFRKRYRRKTMGRKPNNEIVDAELAKRLKQLRESVYTDSSFIKERCRGMKEGKGACGHINDSEACYKNCRTFKAKSLTPQILGAIFSETGDADTSIIYSIEDGKKRVTPGMKSNYKEFFGEELFNRYVLNENDIFVKSGTSRPPCFLHRELELRKLCDKVKNNVVTVVCADGGVGKTTLVEQFLFEYSGEFDYYQTITVDFDSEESKIFELKRFLGALKLTVQGESELSDNIEAERAKWVGDRLCELKNGALFVLDNFACVGNEIRELERNFPNCRFIITTRKTKGIRPECVLHIGEFDNEKACELFEIYLQRQNNPLNEIGRAHV